MSIQFRLYGIYVILFMTVVCTSCNKNRIFDKNMSIPSSGWNYDDGKSFETNIPDTNATYNFYINVRHTDAYPYSNIWVQLSTLSPDSVETHDRINVELAKPDGEWTGNCVDGICYNTVLIKSNFSFKSAGKYAFMLQQDMRMNPLPDIMDVGIKIEKFETK